MKPPTKRLAYLDWMRGLAAAVMLQGHVFHSFLRDDLRNSGAYMFSQFVGGMPPAIFMFLLGVTFAFRMDSDERRGVAPSARFRSAVKRSGQIFALAAAFRLQMWIVSIDKSPWTDLLRVDVLNTMGFALLILAVMAAFRTVERIRLCAILGAAIAGLSPVVSSINWNGVPPIVKHYIAPDTFYFGFFPWAAFVAFGMSAGSLMRYVDREQIGTVMQWIGGGGVAIAFGSWVVSNIPFTFYSGLDFWMNSPTLVFIKLGVLMMILAFAWIWNLGRENQWSWLRQFGVTSLLIYWVHVEMVYGRTFWFLKESLTIPQTVAAAIVVTLLMLGLSLARTNWTVFKAWLRSPYWPISTRQQPSEAAGD